MNHKFICNLNMAVHSHVIKIELCFFFPLGLIIGLICGWFLTLILLIGLACRYCDMRKQKKEESAYQTREKYIVEEEYLCETKAGVSTLPKPELKRTISPTPTEDETYAEMDVDTYLYSDAVYPDTPKPLAPSAPDAPKQQAPTPPI